MKVYKFGGTSVGSAQRMKSVANLIIDSDPKIVVLSAMSGTTNCLVKISENIYQNNQTEAGVILQQLESKYFTEIEILYQTDEYKQKAKNFVCERFDYIRDFFIGTFTEKQEKLILAQGELLSTNMFQYYLEEQKINSALLSALNFMRVDKNHEPDDFYIRESLQREVNQYPNTKLFITQGYICKNAFGDIDNLQRGGSDYSASLIGAAIDAEEVQIWTDISGFHNNDPRYVKNTKPIEQLSFDEAAELAYFGASILHPTSVLPAQMANIPVRLKNTMEPEHPGTLITQNQTGEGIKAIAAKDGITAVKIKSGRMLLAYGFLRRIFEIFEKYKTPIDMITTSEVAVSVTIDSSKHLQSIVAEIENLGHAEIDENQTIICAVGDFVADKTGVAYKVVEALKDIPIRMISYGGSNFNISLLIDTKYKKDALIALSEHIFEN